MPLLINCFSVFERKPWLFINEDYEGCLLLTVPLTRIIVILYAVGQMQDHKRIIIGLSKHLHLPHRSSSSPFPQSITWSQSFENFMHNPLKHINSPVGHDLQPFSSDPSIHPSITPLHRFAALVHFLFSHWKVYGSRSHS